MGAGARSLRGLYAGAVLGIAAGGLLHIATSGDGTKSQLEVAKDSAKTVAEELKN